MAATYLHQKIDSFRLGIMLQQEHILDKKENKQQ